MENHGIVVLHKTDSSCGHWEVNPYSATYNLQQTIISNFAAFSKITNKV